MMVLRLAQYASLPIAVCALGISAYNALSQQMLLHDYVMSNPEVVADSLIRLSDRQNQEALARTSIAIKEGKLQLQPQPYDLVINPQGKYTVVEFFDYNCPFCHQASKEIEEFASNHPNVRFILKNLPILGPDSVKAATVVAKAIAAAPGKATLIHDIFMTQRNDSPNISAVAQNHNIDLSTNIPDIERSLENNKQLAKRIGTHATPSFVYNGELITGGDLKWLEEIPKS